MLGRLTVVVSLLAIAAAVTGRAAAQSVAPCDPGRNAPVMWDAYDSGGALFATHTIEISLRPEPSTGEIVDDSTVKLAFPPGVTVFDASTHYGKQQQYSNEQLAIQTDTPGPMTATATWEQDDVNGRCSGGTSNTFQIQPAAPLKLGKPPKRLDVTRGPWTWLTRTSPGSDLRPLEIRARSWKKARLPGASLPFRTRSVALRASERLGGPDRVLRIPRLKVDVYTQDNRLQITGDIKGHGPVGYEVQVLQGGRQLGRVRAAGHCGSLGCSMKIVKVQH